MKAKLFAKLKQEYSSLGLGDDILMSRAESLAALGLVTDENIDAVVAVQRKDLEGLQKANDKRVTDALEKERKKHEEEAARKKAEEEEARKKAAEEEARKKLEGKEPPTPDARYDELKKQLDEIIASGKQKEELNAATIKGLTDARTTLEQQVKELTDKNAAAEAQAAKAARNAKILAKAKELGVPQWRIDEGFTIADDATDDTISETLTKVANNINTNLLPGNRGSYGLGKPEPTKDELSALAASIVK